jgi:hypothetical protein
MAKSKTFFGNCTVERTVCLRYKTLNLATGELRPTGKTETVTQKCGKPIFTDTERRIGVCQACGTGWEVAGNCFADGAERQRAQAAWQAATAPLDERVELAKLTQSQREAYYRILRMSSVMLMSAEGRAQNARHLTIVSDLLGVPYVSPEEDRRLWAERKARL